MKKMGMLLLVVAFVFTFSSICTAHNSPLGPGNIAVKLNYISFTEDEDTGIYTGIEGYGEIRPNLYLGAEIGYSDSVSEPDVFIPIELNIKYAIMVTPEFIIDIGAGGSYNYAEEEHFGNDWVWGLQFFVDCNYKINKFFIGINGKYQQTEHFKDTDIDFNNWRFGGQIGLMF